MNRNFSKSGIETLSLVGLFASIFLTALPAQAGKFANQFIEFEIPSQWRCTLEGAEWICQSDDPTKRKEAIIILAAKLRGPQDTQEQYLDYLKQPKSYTSAQGKPVRSEPKYSKVTDVKGKPWVDSLHMESEIPGYYTRYLATIEKDIGVLLTYSVVKDKWSSYQGLFDSLVSSLKVFRKEGGLNAGPAGGNLFKMAQVPSGITDPGAFPDESAEKPAPKSDGGLGTKLPLLLAAGAVVYFLMRRKK